MSTVPSILGIVPSGSKLTTYDPNRPDWTSNTPAQDSAARRNYFGFLIEQGTKTATKQLVILVGGQDAQEQAGHKVHRYVVDYLLSGSSLAVRLLNRFSFLVLPFLAQQAVRDGLSRFPYDCPPPGEPGNMLADGQSDVGSMVGQYAVDSWVADHPNPPASVFCLATFHCNNGNQPLTDAHVGDPTTPTAPYGEITFPGYANTLDGGASVFRDASNNGFDAVAWPEFLKGANITKGGYDTGIDLTQYGGDTFYFELPWRQAGNKASFFYRPDALQNFALGFLQGLATVANAVEAYAGSGADVAGSAQIATPAGMRGALGTAATISGTSAVSGAAGRKSARGTAAGISGASAIASVPGTKAGSGAILALSGTAALALITGRKATGGPAAGIAGASAIATATGSTFIALACGALPVSGAAAVLGTQGRKDARGVASAITGNAAVALVAGFGSQPSSAGPIVGYAAISPVLGWKMVWGSALAVAGTAAISVAGVVDMEDVELEARPFPIGLRAHSFPVGIGAKPVPVGLLAKRGGR